MSKLYNIVILFIFILFLAFILLYVNDSIKESFLVIEKNNDDLNNVCKRYNIDNNSIQCKNIKTVKTADEVATWHKEKPGHIIAKNNNKWKWYDVGIKYWNEWMQKTKNIGDIHNSTLTSNSFKPSDNMYTRMTQDNPRQFFGKKDTYNIDGSKSKIYLIQSLVNGQCLTWSHPYDWNSRGHWGVLKFEKMFDTRLASKNEQLWIYHPNGRLESVNWRGWYLNYSLHRGNRISTSHSTMGLDSKDNSEFAYVELPSPKNEFRLSLRKPNFYHEIKYLYHESNEYVKAIHMHEYNEYAEGHGNVGGGIRGKFRAIPYNIEEETNTENKMYVPPAKVKYCDDDCEPIFKHLPKGTSEKISTNTLKLKSDAEIDEFLRSQKIIANSSDDPVVKKQISKKWFPCTPIEKEKLDWTLMYEVNKAHINRSLRGEPNQGFMYKRYLDGFPLDSYIAWDLDGNYCNNKEAARKNISLIEDSKKLDAPVNYFITSEFGHSKLADINNRINKINKIQESLNEIDIGCDENDPECNILEIYEISEYYVYVGNSNKNEIIFPLKKKLNMFQMVLPLPFNKHGNSPDRFNVEIHNNDTSKFTIKRADVNGGWGMELKLKVIDIRKSPYVNSLGGVKLNFDFENQKKIQKLKSQHKDNVLEDTIEFCYSGRYDFFILTNPEQTSGKVDVYVSTRTYANDILKNRIEYNVGWMGDASTNDSIIGSVYELYKIVKTPHALEQQKIQN